MRRGELRPGGEPAPVAAGPSSAWLDAGERLLESTWVRLVLSFVIVVSVLPEATLAAVLPARALAGLHWIFLAIFLPELALRAGVTVRRLRRGEAGAGEALLLALDVLAVASFLPLQRVVHDLAWLRIVRLARLLLLVGYWGGTMRELWSILSGRERRSQVVFVLLAGLLFAFGAAVLLAALGARFDFDGDGAVGGGDRSFLAILWWSFLQVEDPGNLVRHPSHLLVLAVSLLLTLAGVLLFSFLVGIGTSAVGELVERARDQPVGLSGHSVVLGLGEHTHFLLAELAELYRKNRRRFRAAVLGAEPQAPDYLHQPAFRGVRYRGGDAVSEEDLARLDVARAKRVLVLGSGGRDPDAEVVSAILAVRSLAPGVPLYPVVEHEKDFQAARRAGGPLTRVVGAGTFLGYYLAQNVLSPGIDRLYRQLLTSAGCEIYTYLYSREERQQLAAAGRPLAGVGPWRRAFRDQGTTLLGLLLASSPGEEPEDGELTVALNPTAMTAPASGQVRGIVGVSLRWDELRQAALDLLETRSARPDGVRAAGAGAAAFADVDFAAPAGPPHRALVCGASPRIPRLVRVLLEHQASAEVTILVRAGELLDGLARDVESALRGELPGLPRPASERLERREVAGGVDLLVGEVGRVRLRLADWTDGLQLARHPDVDLASTDVVLLLPHPMEAAEPDGLVALDALRMADLAAGDRVRLPAGFRVVGVMQDPVKADLLEQRLRQVETEVTARFTIVAAERVRHHYVMQNLFVRALNSVYLELLGPGGGQQLRRLVPRAAGRGRPEGTVALGALAEELATLRRQVLVAVELAGGEVVADPRRLSVETVDWADVAAVCLLKGDEKGDTSHSRLPGN